MEIIHRGVYMPKINVIKDRTGETRVMNNGLKATITECINCNNITVQFENGVIVKKRRYDCFILGKINCPMIYKDKGDYVECENPNTKTVFLIDKEDLGKLGNSFWCTDNRGYVINMYTGKLHRVIMDCPKDKVVDHINHDKLDNRKANLRVCSVAENTRNMIKPKHNTSGYKGVSWHNQNKKWRASIGKNKKYYTIGLFSTPEEAHAAYCKAAEAIFGEYASLG